MLIVARVLLTALFVAGSLLAVASEAVAQNHLSNSRERQPARTGRLSAVVFRLDRLPVTGADSRVRAQPAQQGSRDSLKNGAIVGAIVGAAALGTFGGLLCNALQEPGTGNCLRDTLRIAAIGAGIGLGAGLLIDAAFTHRGGARISMRMTF